MKEFTHLILPDIEEMLRTGSSEEIIEATRILHPADLADLLVNLPDDARSRLFLALDEERQVLTFEQLEEEEQVELVDIVGVRPMAPVIDDMSSDDRADLAANLEEDTLDRLLPLLDKQERRDVRKLLAYGEETAGAIMSTEHAFVYSDRTVSEAIEHLRKHATELETIYYVYVVDPKDRLAGIVTLRDLILSEPDVMVETIMKPDVITVQVEADQEEVARAMEHYDFLVMPVVDESQRLLGIVTHDDVIDVIEEEATEDAHLMGAVAPLGASYLRTSLFQLAYKRGGWLSLLFMGGTLTATTLKYFETSLKTTTILIVFLPLIISSGGNSGSQSATLITRGLAVGDISPGDWFIVFWRELRVGLLLGAGLGSLGFLYSSLFFGVSIALSFVILLTLIGVCVCGTLVGSLLPLGFELLGFDPAVASNPFIASFVDVTGILIYFAVALLILPS